MQQSDLYLLQSVPPYHLQALVKARRSLFPLKDLHLEFVIDPASAQITEIAQHLFDPTAIRDTLQSLSESEVIILKELVSCGGRANSRDLALYLTMAGLLHPPKSKRETTPLSKPAPSGTFSSAPTGEHGTVVRHASQGGPPQYPAPHPHGTFEQAVHRLLVLGLLFWGKQTNFVGRDYASGVYDGVLIVPQAVMEIANEEWQLDEKEGTASLFEGVELGEAVQGLQRTLYLYWSIVAGTREGLPLINNKLLARSSLRQVLEQVQAAGMTHLVENGGIQLPEESQAATAHRRSDHEREQSTLYRSPTGSLSWSSTMPLIERIRTESDVPHLLFIRLLLIKLGLLYERRGVLYAAPADAFFALPLLERARRCYRLWLESSFWNELVYLPDVVLRPAPAPLEPANEESVRARQFVVQRVLHAQPETWHELAVFIARTKLYVPYLLFPRQYGSRVDRYSIGSNPYGWDFRLRRGWLTHREGWHQVEGGFIRSIVSGPLRWLGLVEINDEKHPGAFRLSRDIELVTADHPIEMKEPEWGRLIVQPNFELVALAPVSEALLVNLDRFA